MENDEREMKQNKGMETEKKKKNSEQHKFVVVCVMQFCDLHIFLMANACMQSVSAEVY